MRPRITLIAHGSTKALRAATFGGDDVLDDIGVRNTENLKGRLGRIDRAFVSPLAGTRQTAELLGLEATVDDRLRECDYGRWTGLKFNQVILKEPRKLISWIRKPATAPHGGETIPQVLERVAAWMRDHSRDEGHTVAITHSGVIRAAIVHVIEAQLPSFWRIDVMPLSGTEFRTNGRRWVLRQLGPLGAGSEDE
ncbi:MAG TPA: histidine phosphatase family protein [Reyranella sp.]|nr:histidine phosphatase family protein [Reyranella sp.]